jgi:ABC-type nitrate/sulfonate/bicarbonate transport system permease component
VTRLLRTALAILVVLALWEAAARAGVLGGRVVPAPSGILFDWWTQRADYALHIAATAKAAALGFLIGNGVAILCAVLFILAPSIERLSRGVTITLFAVPAITIGQVLVVAYDGIVPQVALSAICVYFPTMVATLIGLREIDPRASDVVRVYGGDSLCILRYVRLRAALPGLLAGLKVAAPAALLGAILAEFGSGSRWGLGTFLLGSLGQANAARLWGIGLSATAVAALGYAIFALGARRVLGATLSVTLAANSAPDRLGSYRLGRPGQRVLMAIGALALPFVVWWAAPRILGLNPIIARDPIDTFHYLALDNGAATARAALLSALSSTLPAAGLGLLLGLAAAFLLASLSVLRPELARLLLPPSLVLQTMPLVALTPMIVLIFGRDLAAMLAVTITVVFFPAYVTLAQGFSLTPPAALDVVRCYGDRPVKSLLLVSVPFSLPYVFAAARLVAPRALLGAMIAEFLATGTGLGQLLNASRGQLDYGMIWATAFASVVVAILAYQAVGLVERLATSGRES